MTMPWRPSEEYYGTGQSFLWRKTNKCDIKRPGSLLRGFSSSPRQKRVTSMWTCTAGRELTPILRSVPIEVSRWAAAVRSGF